MTSLDLVITAIVAGCGAYFGSYLRKKGEYRATHENINRLVAEMSAVTNATKRIEAEISNVTWKRERKCELQLKAIDEFNGATSEYISRAIRDPNFNPSDEWFASFDASGALIEALFDDEAYASYEKLKNLVGPGLGAIPGVIGKTTAEMNFYKARTAALKAMLKSVMLSNIE